MIHKIKTITIVFVCFCFLMSGTKGYADEMDAISLYATAAVLMDADSGRVLYGKNEDQILAMASTTKIMTCIIMLENGNLEDTVSVSAYAASMPKVKLYLKKGEQYILKDLVYSLMLESHNDSAVAIAEHIGKTFLSTEIQQKPTSDFTTEESKQAVAAFATLMNQKARDIGCKDTWFITPNGLDATETITLESGDTITKEHSTTASDLAKIMTYCIRQSPQKDMFLNITRTSNHSFSSNGRNLSCSNHNAFLNMMDGALSGKTGFTSKAGYCYIGALQRDGKTLVVALLACGWPNHKTYKWSDTRALMQYGLENYSFQSLDELAFDEHKLTPIPVANGQTNHLDKMAFTNVKIVGRDKESSQEATSDNNGITGLLLKENEKIDVVCTVKKQLEAPISEGTAVGNIQYVVEGQVYKAEVIVTTDYIKKINYKWCFRQIVHRFLVL